MDRSTAVGKIASTRARRLSKRKIGKVLGDIRKTGGTSLTGGIAPAKPKPSLGLRPVSPPTRPNTGGVRPGPNTGGIRGPAVGKKKRPLKGKRVYRPYT